MINSDMKVKSVVLIIAAASLLAITGCGRVGRSASRRVMKSEARAVEGKSALVLHRDLVRDKATIARKLPSKRTVFRYTTRAQAEKEMRRGIKPGSHLTSRAYPGRPLKATNAQARYGLPQKPDVRMTVTLPKGTKVRRNRALGGAPGVGEITSVQRTKPRAIKKVVPLSQ
jgi:hypothetical protein